MNYQKAISIIEEVKKAVKGKDDVIEKVMLAILAQGHVLMEDIPGVGKTTLALAFAKSMKMDVNRMQFTIDVLPSDVVGFSMYNMKTQDFEYHEGAVMCNLFLADEINRTSSKTQSALLEAMEEGQVTVDGISRKIPEPFTVIATQNPAGSAGTQMLPESQLDRFMLKLSMGYPDAASEVSILQNRSNKNILDDVGQIVSKEDIIELQKETAEVHVDKAVYEYMVMLCAITREHPFVELGVSPRGTVALAAIARAKAYLSGRTYVTPDDVKEIFPYVVRHRIVLNAKSRVQKATVDDVIKSVFKAVPTPRPVKK